MQTGNEEFDQLVAVILTSGMFLGAAIACFLDNTIPGTDKERGEPIINSLNHSLTALTTH